MHRFFLLALLCAAQVDAAEETHSVKLANGKTVKIVCEGDVCKVVNPPADSTLPPPPQAAANANEKPADEPKMDADDEIDCLRRELRQARKARLKIRDDYAEQLAKAKAESNRADAAARSAHGRESDLRAQAGRDEKTAIQQEAKMQRTFEAAYRKAYADLEEERKDAAPAAGPHLAPVETAKPVEIDGVRGLSLISDTTKAANGAWNCVWCQYQETALTNDAEFSKHYAAVFSRLENGSPEAQQTYPEHQVINSQGQTVMSPGTPRWRLDTAAGKTFYRAGYMKMDVLKQWIKECTEAK